MTVIIDGTTGIQVPDGSGSVPSYSNDGDGNTGLFFPAADTVAFATSGSERLRIDSSGNAGLGVTPSAWNGSSKAFQYGTNSALENYTGLNSQYLYNAFRNSSNAYTYITNNYALAYSQNSSGEHAWFTAPSGTAGNNITFTQAMTLDADGRLLIGTTSQSASRLVAIDNTGTAVDVGIIQNGNTTGFTSNVLVLGATRNTSNSTYNFLSCVVQNVGFRLYIRDSGNVENSNNSYGAISDIKLKENIVDATPKLDDLLKVRIRQYNFKSDESKRKQIGVVAQELEHVFPGLVEEFADRDAENNDLGTTTKSVKYSVFVPMLIKAIQELKAELDATKAKVAALEGK